MKTILLALLLVSCAEFVPPKTDVERANCCRNLDRNVAAMYKSANTDSDSDMGAVESYQREYYEKCGCSSLRH